MLAVLHMGKNKLHESLSRMLWHIYAIRREKRKKTNIDREKWENRMKKNGTREAQHLEFISLTEKR